MSNNTTAPQEELELVERQITQICNAQLLVLKEVHDYLVPAARRLGVELDAAAAHAWAVSCWITVAQGTKAYWKMPTTRFEPPEPQKEKKPPAPSVVPFGTAPNVAAALKKLRAQLAKDKVNESEVMDVLREAAPRGTEPPQRLEDASERTLQLLMNRWIVTRELIEAARQENNGPEAA